MTLPSRWILCLGLLLTSLGVTGNLSAQEPNRDKIIAAVVAAAEPEIIQSIDAPDGSQRAEVIVYPCVDIGEQIASYERLDLINNATAEKHLVADQVINCGGLGAYGLWVLRWSDGSAFLYYTDAREGTPDGVSVGWLPPVWRVRLADLQTERLGQALFSPDGAWLVTWDREHIRLVPTNSNKPIVLDLLSADLTIVEVIWLPDNSGLLYIQADTLLAPISRSVVTHIDATTLTQTLLLDTGSKEIR
jgi:hypothetical protein